MKEARKNTMKDQNEIELAWQLWNLASRLNALLWDRYEDDFFDIYALEEADRYMSSIDELPPNSANTDPTAAKQES